MTRSQTGWLLFTLFTLGVISSSACSDSTSPDGDADGDVDSDIDADADYTTEPGCPAPPVFCGALRPDCEGDTYPVADPCPNGWCEGRCYTGDCAPCGNECETDDDCRLVGRFDCCIADLIASECAWAAPAPVAERPCHYDANNRGERPAECDPGCPPMGDPVPPELACQHCDHCGPQAARCEGGYCVEASPGCEPSCGCD